MRRYGDNVTTDDILDQPLCESSQGTRVMFGGCGWGAPPQIRSMSRRKDDRSIIEKVWSFLSSRQNKTTADKK